MKVKRTSGKQRTLGGVSLMCVRVDGGLEDETSGNRRAPACDAVIPVGAEPHLADTWVESCAWSLFSGSFTVAPCRLCFS